MQFWEIKKASYACRCKKHQQIEKDYSPGAHQPLKNQAKTSALVPCETSSRCYSVQIRHISSQYRDNLAEDSQDKTDQAVNSRIIDVYDKSVQYLTLDNNTSDFWFFNVRVWVLLHDASVNQLMASDKSDGARKRRTNVEYNDKARLIDNTLTAVRRLGIRQAWRVPSRHRMPKIELARGAPLAQHACIFR